MLALEGQDDALSPPILEELKRSPAGGGPLLLALSATLAETLRQHHDDAVDRIRQHLASLVMDAG